MLEQTSRYRLKRLVISFPASSAPDVKPTEDVMSAGAVFFLAPASQCMSENMAYGIQRSFNQSPSSSRAASSELDLTGLDRLEGWTFYRPSPQGSPRWETIRRALAEHSEQEASD